MERRQVEDHNLRRAAERWAEPVYRVGVRARRLTDALEVLEIDPGGAGRPPKRELPAARARHVSTVGVDLARP